MRPVVERNMKKRQNKGLKGAVSLNIPGPVLVNSHQFYKRKHMRNDVMDGHTYRLTDKLSYEVVVYIMR